MTQISYLPDNPKEYIPLRNKALPSNFGKGFLKHMINIKLLGSGSFGTTFQDPDDPTKVSQSSRIRFVK